MVRDDLDGFENSYTVGILLTLCIGIKQLPKNLTLERNVNFIRELGTHYLLEWVIIFSANFASWTLLSRVKLLSQAQPKTSIKLYV